MELKGENLTLCLLFSGMTSPASIEILAVQRIYNETEKTKELAYES